MEHMPTPFLSLIIDDCVSKGLDYIRGGARYNSNYIQGVGMGTITDSLTAIRKEVYDDKAISLSAMVDALVDDFKNNDELLYRVLYQTPKYGNDDLVADRNLRDVFEIYHAAVTGKLSPRGATYRINLLPTTCHVYFGSVMHAGPDGRRH